MPSDQHRPRSQRRRHRARARPFSFRFVDGKIFEETTELEVPHPGSIFATGHLPPPERRGDAVYFDLNGRPMCEETRLFLHNWFRKYLFLIDGKLRPEARVPGVGSDEREWNRYFSAIGHGRDAGYQPWEAIRNEGQRWAGPESAGSADDVTSNSDDEEPERDHRQEDLARWKDWTGATPDAVYGRSNPRRALVLLPRSDWHRLAASRLAVIFDRDPRDPLVQKLAGYLSRDRDWLDWCSDPELQSLYAQAFNDKERWALLRKLEGITFERGGRARERRSAREPFRMSFTTASGVYVFALPRRPPGEFGKTTIRLGAWVFAAHHHFVVNRTIDPRVLTAVVWKAGRLLEQPVALKKIRLTLRRVAAHFGLTARKVQYAAEKLWPEVEALVQSANTRSTHPSVRV